MVCLSSSTERIPDFGLIANRKFRCLILWQEGEGHGGEDTREGREMVPADFFAEIQEGKDGENGERDDFLNHLELERRIDGVAPAVGGDLKTVFEKRDAPAHEN